MFIDDTLGPETLEYCMNHANVTLSFADLNGVANLLRVAPKCPQLTVIVCMDRLFTQPMAADWRLHEKAAMTNRK